MFYFMFIILIFPSDCLFSTRIIFAVIFPVIRSVDWLSVCMYEMKHFRQQWMHGITIVRRFRPRQSQTFNMIENYPKAKACKWSGIEDAKEIEWLIGAKSNNNLRRNHDFSLLDCLRVRNGESTAKRNIETLAKTVYFQKKIEFQPKRETFSREEDLPMLK